MHKNSFVTTTIMSVGVEVGVIKLSSKCHLNVIIISSKLHENVIKITSKCHQNVIKFHQMTSKCIKNL